MINDNIEHTTWRPASPVAIAWLVCIDCGEHVFSLTVAHATAMLSTQPENVHSHEKNAVWGLGTPDCGNGGPGNGVPNVAADRNNWHRLWICVVWESSLVRWKHREVSTICGFHCAWSDCKWRMHWSQFLQLDAWIQRSSVLSAFNFKRLAAIHCSISSMHCARRTTPQLTASGLQCNRTCVSSAYEWRFTFHLTVMSASFAVYRINSRGLRLTPVVQSIQVQLQRTCAQ